MQETHEIGHKIMSEDDVSSVSDTSDLQNNPTSTKRSGARTSTTSTKRSGARTSTTSTNTL